MSTAVCDFLYCVYYAAGRYDRAMQFLVLSKGRDEMVFPHDLEERISFFRKLSAASLDVRFAPFAKVPYLVDGVMQTRTQAIFAEELPRFSKEMPAYWAGIYNPYRQICIKDKVLELMNTKADEYDLPIYNDFLFDLMKAQEHTEIHAEPEDGSSILLPIAGKTVRQSLHFTAENLQRTMLLSKAEFNFYRIEEPVTIHSELPFAVGAPIVLRHSLRRRKLVLNILADGLS